MSAQTHELKADPIPFQDVASGRKNAEVRYDDRGYQHGDVLHLRETRYSRGQMLSGGAPLEYTGRELRRTITHIQRGYGLPDGVVVLSLSSYREGDHIGQNTTPAGPPELDRVWLHVGGSNFVFGTADATALAQAALYASDKLKGAYNSPALQRGIAERVRQMSNEGWTHEHDDEHHRGELAMAASCYAIAGPRDLAPAMWPWDIQWWKPALPERNLEKAFALILAEMERRDRAITQTGGEEVA